jgi:hypothetical protein
MTTPARRPVGIALASSFALLTLNAWALPEEATKTVGEGPPAAEPAPASPKPEPATKSSEPADEPPVVPPAPAEVEVEVATASRPPLRDQAEDSPPTLLNSRLRIGGYGGMSAAYTHMLGRHGTLVGGEGAVLFNHRLSLGLAGYGFLDAPRGPADADGNTRRFGTGYGGFVARYAFLTRGPFYVSAGALIGGGILSLQRDRGWDDDDDRNNNDDGDWDRDSVDPFFIVQQELTAHVNLTRWMRVGATAGYRFVNGISRFGFEERDMAGVVLGSQLQMGWL